MSDKPATGVKPIFCGNFRYDEPRHHVEDLFRERGEMLRLDMKRGFAFVYMAKQEDAERCIAELHNHDLGGRKLLVSFAKGDGDTKRREDQRKANQQPTKTLFVANFELMRNDQFQTERELESRFLEYGKLTRCQLRAGRSGSYFAFVEYEQQADSTKALEELNGAPFGGAVLAVEYTTNSGGGGGGGGGPPPSRGGYGGYGGPPPRRFDDRGPPPRRYDDYPPRRYDDRGYDRGYDRGNDRGNDRGYDRRSPPRDRYRDDRRDHDRGYDRRDNRRDFDSRDGRDEFGRDATRGSRHSRSRSPPRRERSPPRDERRRERSPARD